MTENTYKDNTVTDDGIKTRRRRKKRETRLKARMRGERQNGGKEEMTQNN